MLTTEKVQAEGIWTSTLLPCETFQNCKYGKFASTLAPPYALYEFSLSQLMLPVRFFQGHSVRIPAETHAVYSLRFYILFFPLTLS